MSDWLRWNHPDLTVKSDSRRTASYRLLQSWYREKVLDVRYGTYGPKDHEKPCGSLLDPNNVRERPGLNFLTNNAAEYATTRAKDVVAEHGSLDPDRLKLNMLSSMPLCFSIFGELRSQHDGGLAGVKALFDPAATAVVKIECEWKPGSNPLSDRTAFDAVIVTQRSNGSNHLIGVECKYTEPFSQHRYDPKHYEVPHDASRWFKPNSAATLSGSSTNQLWRNLLLASECARRGELGASTAEVCIVALAEDTGVDKARAGLAEQLLEPELHCRFVPLETIATKFATVPGLVQCSESLNRRYIDRTPLGSE